ncbi:hypothetical protein BJ875DRAFT_441327 [Amylocarpus encephaloides]|uniref:GPI anchored serine-threonine rich protein n=1 Tax=Amylocarpus encephaloides TaxID=45428 RepID=A0A9P8C6T5_9HELO|nr:hypothetical protein BJ875DRAFT_441327 [Amylocarpus encephaloides]
MLFSTALPLSLLTLAVAQTTTRSADALTTSTACAAQNVFDVCVTTGQGYASSCSGQDWGCLCQKWTDILTCYLQCPSDAGQAAALSTKTTYCNNAVVYSSSISKPFSAPISASTGAASAATGANSATTSGGVKASGTSGAVASQTSGSSAEKLVVGAGGLVMGLVAAVL